MHRQITRRKRGVCRRVDAETAAAEASGEGGDGPEAAWTGEGEERRGKVKRGAARRSDKRATRGRRQQQRRRRRQHQQRQRQRQRQREHQHQHQHQQRGQGLQAGRDERMGEWVDGVDGWTGGRTDRQAGRQNRRTDRQTDRMTDGQGRDQGRCWASRGSLGQGSLAAVARVPT